MGSIDYTWGFWSPSTRRNDALGPWRRSSAPWWHLVVLLLLLQLLLISRPSAGKPGVNFPGEHHQLHVEAADGGGGGGGNSHNLIHHGGAPRILTVLTTYNNRMPFMKTYMDAALNRTDGYQPWIFVASDVDAEDPEGVVDYKVGEPQNHRLLEAMAEAYSRFKGRFDWIAVGDDDTVFMYKRAMSLLENLDHTQPLAFGRVDGLCGQRGLPSQGCMCLKPSETKIVPREEERHCCLDFTRSCDVPVFNKTVDTRFHKWYQGYTRGELFWAFGGSGFFLSSGLADKLDGGVDGWRSCVDRFSFTPTTDVQVAMCMAYRGISMSLYPGFAMTFQSEADHIRRQVAANCQTLAIHLGIKRIRKGKEYTLESFGAAVSAVTEEDEAWASVSGNTLDLSQRCPKASAALAKWQS